MDVREVIVAGWWRGWELCSELGSFGSTAYGDQSSITRTRTNEKYLHL
ncbi:MAG: hypothetical protein J7J03_07010 [Methanosarcinales archaeon]|nr:hypothetical protein [Methanosarcinales archaeon]